MKALLVSSFLAISFLVAAPSVLAAGPGIGRFEQNQILVTNFMSFVGWDERTTYEETGLNMRALLLKLIQKDKESREWMIQVIQYINSPEYKKQTTAQKQKDIFTAKVVAKMAIKEKGILRK